MAGRRPVPTSSSGTKHMSSTAKLCVPCSLRRGTLGPVPGSPHKNLSTSGICSRGPLKRHASGSSSCLELQASPCPTPKGRVVQWLGAMGLQQLRHSPAGRPQHTGGMPPEEGIDRRLYFPPQNKREVASALGSIRASPRVYPPHSNDVALQEVSPRPQSSSTVSLHWSRGSPHCPGLPLLQK